jgi:hypothetical protein
MTRTKMDEKLERLLDLTDRVLMHLEHDVPPETLAVTELRKLVNEMKRQRTSSASSVARR